MKREGMPTQRLEEKRVEEHVREQERERGERERKSAHMQERKRERAIWPLLICFCLHLGLPCANWA